MDALPGNAGPLPKPAPRTKRSRKPIRRTKPLLRKKPLRISAGLVRKKSTLALYGRPQKQDRPGEKRKRETKKADREFQSGVEAKGQCNNCQKWRPLVGDHIIKRRFRGTRHLPTNRRAVCAECNGDFESLPASKLIQKYPRSPLRDLWKDRAKAKGPIPSLWKL